MVQHILRTKFIDPLYQKPEQTFVCLGFYIVFEAHYNPALFSLYTNFLTYILQLS